jgi:hypothetical protein
LFPIETQFFAEFFPFFSDRNNKKSFETLPPPTCARVDFRKSAYFISILECVALRQATIFHFSIFSLALTRERRSANNWKYKAFRDR